MKQKPNINKIKIFYGRTINFLGKNWLILLIVLLGLILRLWGTSYGLPSLFVGDEKSLVGGALKMIYEQNIFPVFQPTVFRLLYYPVLIPWIYLVVFIPYVTFVYLIGNFVSVSALRDYFIMNPANFFLMARVINACFSAASVYVIYLITHKIFSKRAGLMAGLLYAVSWLPVHQGHFSKHWNVGIFFALLSVYFSFLILENNCLKNYILAGIVAGMAGFANYVTALYGVILVIIHFVFNKSSLKKKLLSKKLWIFIIIILVIFSLAILTYPQEFYRLAIGEDSTATHSKTLLDFVEVNFEVFKTLYYLATFVFILSLFGYLLLFFKNKKLFLALAFIPFISPFLYYFLLHFEPRYVLLFLPILAIVAGFSLDEIIKILRIKSNLAVSLICLGIIFLPVRNAIVFDRMLCQTDTRNVAKQWIEENLPVGSKIITNSWEFDLVKNKECLNQQQQINNMSLRTRDYVMMSRSFPNSYCVWNINLIYALPPDVDKYEYYLIDGHTARKVAYLGDELMKRAELIKRFDGSRLGPAEQDITMFVHQRLEENKKTGPYVEIYKLK